MRWLYHLTRRGETVDDAYFARCLERDGFVHCSYRDAVAETARLYFDGVEVSALQIDPRRLAARVDVAGTPRGPMPHVHGLIERDALRGGFELEAIASAPDLVKGTRFGFVAFDGMTLLDLVGMHDPISRIASMGFDGAASCEIVGATGARVWAADGASLSVERVRPALDEFDVVLVPGGFGARQLVDDAAVVRWLAAFPANRLIASVCTGALLLGAAGRLHGKRATTHRSAMDRLAAYGAIPTRERVVDEGQLVTAGGVTSALDLGIHVARRFEGPDVAAKIAAQMELA